MTNESQIKAWRKYRRQSIQAMPIAVALLIIAHHRKGKCTGNDHHKPKRHVYKAIDDKQRSRHDAINIMYLDRRLRSHAASKD